MQVKTFIFNPFSVNTYLIWNDNSKDAIVIDPGCFNEFEEEELFSYIKKIKLNIKYLFNTHCHIDHILGNAFMLEKYKPKFYIGKEDEFLLDGANEQAERFGMRIKLINYERNYFNENEDIELGNIRIRPIHTPGHSPGSYSFYIHSQKVCFTGDVLFGEGIGRTDLWGGSFETLKKAIVEKLFALPNETDIYPGHAEITTIGYEKRYNEFLK
ncbi:MAG: MBL fold metallo-hydrolase [Ignavibacteriales bacterium]|nr:MBL fold metallo-hydrolase [Ignavibacteriales bacterium]